MNLSGRQLNLLKMLKNSGFVVSSEIKKIKLAYGKIGLVINLPNELDVTIVEPKYIPGLNDQAEAISSALKNPPIS